jgi:hypothetical protein
MSTNETKTPKVTKDDDRVEIFVPRVSGNTDPNQVIVLNGKNYILPRGKKSLVPKAVAAEYERSVRAQHKMDDAIVDMVEQARQQAVAAGLK